MPRLASKVALVTGAARGIGAAIARAFVAEGAVVYLSDLAESAGADTAAELGRNARWLELDVREEDHWQHAMEVITRQSGRLDILVNNAGITGFEANTPQDPEHASLASWRAVMATNLDGVFLGCRYAIQAMRAQRGVGAIINLSSRSGQVGIAGAAAYAASKAAVRNHSKTVALYCAEQGLAIRCNSLHPGAILTPMWEALLGEAPEREANMAAFVHDTPLRRFGTPEEVAAVAVMLASDECPYMTGSELTIDGGLLAGSAAAPGSS
ncbi:MAG: SDR family oxidoreductase [Gammaproteobacteria bacterium]|nr:SDR family oxidoreductase [Gammaproteobacteria bacterium]